MEDKNSNLNLFSDQSDELISLDDEEIVPEDNNRKRDREPMFGGKNLVFFFLILLLTLATVVFMNFERLFPDDSTTSAESSLEASETFLENTSSEESFADESSEENISEPENTSEVSEESTVQESDFHGWIINNMGYTYLYYGVGVEQFNYSNATFTKYQNSIDALSAKVPDGINVYCMPVPTRVGFLYNEISNDIKKEDNFYNSLQETFLDTLEEKLNDRITFVNLYDRFENEYLDGRQLYFNTDLNWTSDAAYMAYAQFCASSGQAPAAIEAYEKNTIKGFLGSFYTATRSEILENRADDFVYYKNSMTDACTVTLYSGKSVYKDYTLLNNTVYGESSAYSVYLGTSGQHFKIETTNTSGKTLLIVGDGSAAAMIPFLVTNYSEIHYIDVGLYQGDFLALFGETAFDDVLMMSYATNSVKGTFPKHLATMAGVDQDE